MSRLSSGLRAVSIATVLLLTGDGRAIIDGTDAAVGEFPWIAGIVRKDVAAPGLVGGGALVGDQWVITAAHSLSGLSIANLEVWLGITDLSDTVSRRTYNVLAVYLHPDFETANGTSVNDLALLLLDRPVSGIDTLPLIENESDLAEGDLVEVSGWGVSEPGLSQPSQILQKAQAEILSLAEAEATYGDVIEPVHLPAVDPAAIATPCIGDSGSPLVKNFSGTDRLAGLVSFGTVDCDDASLPTIYTRIPLFAIWINAYLNLTEEPSRLSLTGRGMPIRERASARSGNATNFGEFTRPRSQRIASFRLANKGQGLLTVREAVVTGRGFSLLKAPPKLIGASKSALFRVKFSGTARSGKFRGRVILRLNDPAQPVFVFKVEATQARG